MKTRLTAAAAAMLLLLACSDGSDGGTTGSTCPPAGGPQLEFTPVNPLPLNQMRAVGGPDASNLWAVGPMGEIDKWDGSAWTAQRSRTNKNLNSVWAKDLTHVFAVGEFGTVVFWNGSTWTPQNSGTTENLNQVFGVDANNVWAVGDKGTVRKWDGSAWAAQTIPTALNLRGVWAADASNAWAVADDAIIFKWDGSTWSSVYDNSRGGMGGFNAIWGMSDKDIWAVGKAGIFRWNGSAWLPGPSTPYFDRTLTSVWGSSASEVWVSGYLPFTPGLGEGPYILKWDGSGWKAIPDGTSDVRKEPSAPAIWGSDATHVWVANYGGLPSGNGLLKWDGSALVETSTGVGQDLDLIQSWGTAPNNIWAMASDGTVLKWSGSAWSVVYSSATKYYLRSAWVLDDKNVWAVGFTGTVLKWDGSALTRLDITTGEGFESIWGTDANNIWIGSRNVGTVQTVNVHKWNGSGFTTQGTGGLGINGLWGSGANNIWGAGEGLLHSNGSSWTNIPFKLTTMSTVGLSGIWGCNKDNVWVSGPEGVLSRWNGTDWNYSTQFTREYLSKIWGTASSDIWLLGERSFWRSPDGNNWEKVFEVGRHFNNIWGTSASDVWLVGQGGAIVHGQVASKND